MKQLWFLAPQALWLLLLLPLVWLLPRPTKQWKSALLRTLTFSALILALAQPGWLFKKDLTYEVWVVDSSSSVGDSARSQLEQFISNSPENPQSEVQRIAVELQATSSDGKVPESLQQRFTRWHAIQSDSESSIGEALQQALRSIPQSDRGEIHLLSDGFSTDRNWGDASRECIERKIPVFTYELQTKAPALALVKLQPQGELRVGQKGKIFVELQGSGTLDLQVELDGETLGQREGLECSDRLQVNFEFEPKRSGFFPLVAKIKSGADGEVQELNTSIAIQDPFRVLYLGERVRGSDSKLAQLIGMGFTFVSSKDLKNDPQDLSQYDLTILDDRPAHTLPQSLQNQIANAVTQDGMGLMMAGGSGSFGPGGYQGTAIGKLAPVDFVQKEEKRDPSTTLVVIIDTSGSMGGERVQLAKETARLAIRRLLPHDKVGIVEFYGTKQWAAPIQSAANTIEIQRALNRLDAGGGTVILPAIEEAFYALQNVQTRYKHVLVLTDGGVEAGDFESLMRKMADRGMNVSTVLVGGSRHSEFLVNLANWGKGHFYNASNRFNIPEILIKQPSTSKIPSYRPGNHGITGQGGPSWWGKVSPENIPPLKGYVETRPREGAEVLIETQKNRHPILASWRHGLGRVTAMTTEPTGEGTHEWRDWNDYGPFLHRVLSRTARDRDYPFQVSANRQGDKVVFRLERITDQNWVPTLALVNQKGELIRELNLERRAPQQFVAIEHLERNQDLFLSAGVQSGKNLTYRVAAPSLAHLSPELQVDIDRALDLERLSTETGGNYQLVAQTTEAPSSESSNENSTANNQHTVQEGSLAFKKLWPICLLIALAIYLCEIIYRRWPREVGTS